jgi:outer membrane protein
MEMKQRLIGSGLTGTGRLVRLGLAALLAVQPLLVVPAAAQPARGGGPAPRTLAEAMAMAYSTNPTLLAERANLRATDETVPGALAGWHPQVTVSASAGYAKDVRVQHTPGSLFGTPFDTKATDYRGVNAETITATQPLYRGGATRANTNRAENAVMAERARLYAQEQTTLLSAVQAYLNVIVQTQLLALNVNNEQVLRRQLQATNDRFRVGELTRTDVAQAEAALAGAVASRQNAEGTLETARASFRDVVGALPGRLAEPQPLRLAAKTLEDAQSAARSNNPNVVAALFDNAAAKDNFDVQYARLLPTLSLQASYGRNEDTQQKNLQVNTAQILAVLSMPLYQGGAEYAAIRQARQQQLQAQQKLEAARSTAQSQAASAWTGYDAAKASIDSVRQQVKANEIALEGVQREALVGSRTTLDVLNAEQALFQSRTSLIQQIGNLVYASYQVASAVGRLTARDLNLNVPLYDETAYYKAVKNLWIGTGDYATDQPGR